MRALVMLAIIFASRAAIAEDRGVAGARKAYGEQEQEKTLELLAPVLAGALSDHDRAAALRLSGCANMLLGKRDLAIAQFRDSFGLEPEAALEPDIATPDMRSLFEVARGEWRAALVAEMDNHAAELAGLQLGVKAPSRARGGEAIAIDVNVADPSHMVSRVELSYRRRGAGAFTLLTSHLERSPLAFSIPPQATESPRPFVLEYHVTLRHQTGFDLRRDGDPDRPRVIAVDAGHVPRWHESWLVRGAIVAAVVGLGVGGYLFYRSIDVGPQHVELQ